MAMKKQSLCKLGFHSWPKGIKTINDWIECDYDDDKISFITEDLNETEEIYFRCTCLKCGKSEVRRYPHHHLIVKFYNLWGHVDFFTPIWIRKHRLEENFRGDFNIILESRYQFIFLNFQIEIITKPIESQPGNIFYLDKISESESLDIYKNQTGHYPDSYK